VSTTSSTMLFSFMLSSLRALAVCSPRWSAILHPDGACQSLISAGGTAPAIAPDSFGDWSSSRLSGLGRDKSDETRKSQRLFRATPAVDQAWPVRSGLRLERSANSDNGEHHRTRDPLISTVGLSIQPGGPHVPVGRVSARHTSSAALRRSGLNPILNLSASRSSSKGRLSEKLSGSRTAHAVMLSKIRKMSTQRNRTEEWEAPSTVDRHHV
jgi:hypothetical protein